MRHLYNPHLPTNRALVAVSLLLGVYSAGLAQDGPKRTPRIIKTSHTSAIVGVAFSPDGKTVATSSRDRTIAFWDVATRKRLHIIRHREPFGPLVFSPDGGLLAVVAGKAQREVLLYDATTRKEKGKIGEFRTFLRSLAFSPDGKILAAKEDGSSVVTFWDTSTGKKTHTLKGHTAVCDFHRQPFSPDGKRFVTGSKDETIRIWDVATGKTLKVLEGHDGPVYCAVTFSPDGKSVVSGGDRDRTVRVWDAETGELKKTLEGHTGGVRFVGFGADSRTIVSVTAENGEVRVWDLATEKVKRSFSWFSGVIFLHSYQSFIDRSPDGKTLAIAIEKSLEHRVELWDLADAR
jgi:WD40 repeat protein